jgi:nitrous oxide reductase
MSNKKQRLDSSSLYSPPPDSQQPDIQRRDFLRGSIATAVATALTAAAGNAVAGVAETTASTAAVNKEGYRLTQHIADYYKSAAL